MRRYGTCVITTIQEPTASLRALQKRVGQAMDLVVIGDKKGPTRFKLPNTRFISLDEQLQSEFKLARLLPVGHYARKNLGYLATFAWQPTAIFDTDDDNAPNLRWEMKRPRIEARSLSSTGWVNVYKHFTSADIWPRGFPLSQARIPPAHDLPPSQHVYSPIQQLLCNNEPDVDAVWRMTIGAGPFTFNLARQEAIHLPPGAWCPFNSQATWWFRDAFPLLYLPSTCTFRMTDIWRSFIAQRCLWELGMGVTFHPPEVIQQRNPHDLMKDFEDEIPGYLQNDRIAQILTALALKPGPNSIIDNLIHCYEALISANILKSDELPLLRAWVDDISPLLCLPSSS